MTEFEKKALEELQEQTHVLKAIMDNLWTLIEENREDTAPNTPITPERW